LNRGDPVKLTHREVEVTRRAAEGWTCRQIADELSISVNTVKTHLEHVYRKLGARNRLEMEHKLFPSRAPPTTEIG